jgi:hypothetical protein
MTPFLLRHKKMKKANTTLTNNFVPGDCVIYLRVRPRVSANAGEPLKLRDVAGFLADARCQLNEMQVILPKGAGVWQVDAPQLVMQIQEKHPGETVSVLGDGIGWLHREAGRKNAGKSGRPSLARVAAVLLALSFAGALFILLFRTGRDENRSHWIALAYAASMLLGAAVYCARLPKMISLARYRAHGGRYINQMMTDSAEGGRRTKKLSAKRGK